jgi:hypothetical protein
VPNAGRIAPYYVQSMWMKDADGLVANLLGPCQLDTDLGTKHVQIVEKTEYPYQNSFSFSITTQTAFVLKIRKPTWVQGITCNQAHQTENGYLKIAVPMGKTELSLTFETAVMAHTFAEKEHYFSYGALVYAHPIAAVEELGKSFPIKGFYDWKYSPIKANTYRYIADHQAKFEEASIQIIAKNEQTQAFETIRLIPLAKTILRQLSF